MRQVVFEYTMMHVFPLECKLFHFNRYLFEKNHSILSEYEYIQELPRNPNMLSDCCPFACFFFLRFNALSSRFVCSL